jgi:serine phosphatase RsbU (regulator of sigma subunit)
MIHQNKFLLLISLNESIPWPWILLVVLGCGVLYFIWKQNRWKQENKSLSDKLSERSYQVMLQKWELERKNLSIGQQNKEIIESLEYARNIQFAILPKTSEVAAHFSDLFILYKPKDIVSGDFYFFRMNEESVYLAAADCTGHGVAGAFMSLVGSSLLHQIIGQKRDGDTAAILGELNEGIVTALQQKDSSSHNGMDIVLVCYDPAKKELAFSGANRPLFFIRDGNPDMIQPDKLPIGGFQPEEDRRFTRQVLPVKPGDCIYLYTDGYADQFGGPNGKKIMTKNFKDLLVSIHSKPMKEQQQLLDDYFEKWRGKYEQVDDVLVIGLRI